MGDHVSWLVELEVKPGRLDGLSALVEEMVESTESEAGTKIYEWWISEDNSTLHLYERYSDSGAALEHLAEFGAKFASRFLAALDPTRLTLYGDPSDEVKEALGAFAPVRMAPFGGFAR